MAALDPIAANIGHGAYGLRSNLRLFSDFAVQTISQKHVFVEIRGTLQVAPGNTFTVVSGTIYEVVFNPGTFQGRTLDVVGARTLNQTSGETLVRRENTSSWGGTSGHYHWAPATNTLTVKLSTTTTNPNSFAVIVEVAFYFSNVPVTLPHFGTEKLTDGGFETWASATDLTNWTEQLSGAGNTVDREGTDVQVGTYALKLTSTGAATGYASAYVSTTGVVTNQAYCVSGRYKTSPTQSANLTAHVVISDGGADTNVVQSDGRSYLTGTEPTLTPTLGEWRRFEFYYVQSANEVTARLRLKLAAASSVGAGYVIFDDVQWRPVWSWNFHESRVQNLEQFQVREARSDIYWGSWTVGVGTFVLINDGPAPGYFEELAGRFNLVNAPVYVRQGGRFPDDSEEVTPTNLYMSWYARIKRPEITDVVASFPIRNPRDLLLSELPDQQYSIEEESDLDTRFDGAVRPLMFGGELAHVNAARVDLTANAYGIYELADPSRSPAGLYDFPSVLIVQDRVGFAYVDAEAAAKQDTAKRMPIYSSDVVGDGTGPHVTLALSTARMTVTEDLKVFYFATPKYLNFTRNGSTFRATVAAGAYIMNTLCRAIQTTANTSASVASITCTYSDSTHKVTFADATAATLTILTRIGTDVAEGIGPTCGYDPGSDKTGALTYTGEAATFTSADVDHILRWTMYGFADDAAGTYTGTAGLRVAYPPDVMRYVLVRHLNWDPMAINTASFNALRATAPIAKMYIGNLDNDQPSDTKLSVRSIFERLEVQSQADLQLVGDTFYLRARSDSVPANVVDIYDTDILKDSFSSWLEDEDVYGTVHVAFDQDPSIGTWRTRSLGLSRVSLLHGRPNQKTFETYIGLAANAENLRDDVSEMAEAPKRRFQLSVKGKLYTKTVADTFRLNRTRGITSTAGASPYTTPVLVRIIDKADRADFVSDIVAVAV